MNNDLSNESNLVTTEVIPENVNVDDKKNNDIKVDVNVGKKHEENSNEMSQAKTSDEVNVNVNLEKKHETNSSDHRQRNSNEEIKVNISVGNKSDDISVDVKIGNNNDNELFDTQVVAHGTVAFDTPMNIFEQIENFINQNVKKKYDIKLTNNLNNCLERLFENSKLSKSELKLLLNTYKCSNPLSDATPLAISIVALVFTVIVQIITHYADLIEESFSIFVNIGLLIIILMSTYYGLRMLFLSLRGVRRKAMNNFVAEFISDKLNKLEQ